VVRRARVCPGAGRAGDCRGLPRQPGRQPRTNVDPPLAGRIGKMHRFNDLPWNPAHRDIQGPLQGVLRTHWRPVQKVAALTLSMLRQILLTCDASARGRRDRALLLLGFTGALRRSELVSLRAEDVAVVAGGLRLRIVRGKTDQAGQGAEIGPGF
jgi:integrase